MLARLIGVATLMTAALVGVAAVGAEVAAAPVFWSAAWADPSGDAGSAPDITGVQLGANDDGRVLIRVFGPTGASDLLQLFIKKAESPSEGDPSFAGANMRLTYNYRTKKVSAVEWDASTQKWYPSIWYSRPDEQLFDPVIVTSSSTSFIVSNLMFSSSESNGKIGLFARLGTVAQYDQAPDSGFYVYDVQPLALSGVAFMSSGKRFGQQLVLSVAVKRSDTDGYLIGGRITCAATAGSHAARGAPLGFVQGGVPFARCGWRLPSSFRGKVVHASITVSFGGRLLTRTTVFTLR